METTQNQEFALTCSIPKETPKVDLGFPVGTQVFINGKLVRCVLSNEFTCINCIFFGNKETCKHLNCTPSGRIDGLAVHFVHVLKD